MNTTKIVFIGAGSMSFGMSMFKDLFCAEELAGSTLSLVDTNPENLQRMTGIAKLMNARTGVGMTIESTTERREALPGAGFVVNSIVIERNRLWPMDFGLPRSPAARPPPGEH